MASFLAADFGIAHTRTLLIDEVEGQHRLIMGTMNRTTVPAPLEDATIALERNLTQLTSMTGREFIGEEGFLDELLITASSAGRPLRAVLLGLMEVSLESAYRALTGTYIEVVESISLADIQTEEERLNRILGDRPDVILIVGGTDDGNRRLVRELVHLVDLAVKLLPANRRPILLYAGNVTLARWVQKRLQDTASIFVAENVRPNLDRESLSPIRLKLAEVFDNFLEKQPGGFADISKYSKTGIIPTAQSATNLVRFLDTLNQDGVFYLDVGSGTSALLAGYDGSASAHIRSNMGMGHGIMSVLEHIDWRDVERWLPFPFSLEHFEEWVHNKWLAPLTIPQTLHDLFIEQAIGREIARFILAEAHKEWMMEEVELPKIFSPVIASRAVFTKDLPPGLAAMLLLDALEAVGVVELWQDPFGLAPALGALSYQNAEAVVQVIDNGGFARLGTAFCPSGRSRQPRASMKVTLTLPGGEVINQQVNTGEIWIPSLPPGTPVDVEVRLPRGLSIAGRRKLTQRVRSGSAGLIFDMRGRPIHFPGGKRRRQLIGEWFSNAAGMALDESIYEDIYETIDTSAVDEMTVVIKADEPPPELDFPNYSKLSKGKPDEDFMRLLKAPAVQAEVAVAPDDDDDDIGGDIDDFARDLGLR